jgi:hypothetical protein
MLTRRILPHLYVPPLPTISGSDLPGIELPGDGVEARKASRLDVPNDRQDVGRKSRVPGYGWSEETRLMLRDRYNRCIT